MPKALKERERRAGLVLAIDDAGRRSIVDKLKKRGFTSPYLRPFVVARINPIRFSTSTEFDFDEVLGRMQKNAAKFNVERNPAGRRGPCGRRSRRRRRRLGAGIHPEAPVSILLSHVTFQGPRQFVPARRGGSLPRRIPRRIDSQILQRWVAEGRVVGVCPEVAGGLGVPRPPAECSGGDGAAVLAGAATVVTRDGADVTDALVAGADMRRPSRAAWEFAWRC